MPKKTPKIDVLTVTLKRHIPIDRKNAASVLEAYSRADELTAAARDYGQAGITTCLNRVAALAPGVEVPAPEASEPESKSEDPRADPADESETTEPADDGMEFPDGLDRRPETAAAE